MSQVRRPLPRLHVRFGGAPLGLAALAAVTSFLAAPDLQAQGMQDFPEIQVGATVEGNLGADAPQLLNGGPFRVFRFQGEAGRRYVADLRSSDFDAYLVLAHPVGGITEVIEEDDDGGEGTDSRLVFTLDQGGTYLLVARGWGSSGSGRFTLALAEREPPPPVEPRPLSRGMTVQSRLDPDTSICLDEWGEEFTCELWTLEVEEGEVLQVSMESDELDPYLDAGMLGMGGALDILQSDDDGGEGNNALLVIRAPSSGTMGIRARAFGFGSDGGAYTLRVGAVEVREVERRSLQVGEQVEGEILPGEAQLAGDDRAVHEWTVEGRAGDRLRIRMRSDDFDTYLAFGREVGEDYEELAANDDAPDDGLNSLIEITLPADGTYLILASPLSGSGTGRYTLEVMRDGT
jgi:hypothetical protein